VALALATLPAPRSVTVLGATGSQNRVPFNTQTVSAIEAIAQVGGLNTGLADPKGVFIEIEGHTDNVGAVQYNQELGLERAEAVKRYLYEAHQVPLHKMNVISYGEEKPVAPNNTKKGRAQNRRVVIKVLA